MNAPAALALPEGHHAEVIRSEEWSDVRRHLSAVDLIVIDCRDGLLLKITSHFLMYPWRRKPLVAVDLVLRKPVRLGQRMSALVKRVLFRRVHHFIHYFRDIKGYTQYFGIPAARSSYVPFKVNNPNVPLEPSEIREDYIFTMGRSLRDYNTFIQAVAELPYPAAIPEFSFEDFEGRDESFRWTKQSVPKQLTIVPDTGSRKDLVRNLARARLVVIPTLPSSLCASGLSTYLDAMFLGKCVIISAGPGASDLLTDQAMVVPPSDVEALKSAIRRGWEDDQLRSRVAAAGRAYAASLGGEPELLDRVLKRAVASLAPSEGG
jgi:glycosyltransferase involved in cell wall biosynthesis